MNITPQVNQLPHATVVNPPTDSLRRDNVQREVIAQPAALSHSAAEKGVASEKERVRTPAQNVEEGIDFTALQEQAELENSTINERQKNQENPQSNASPEQREDDAESQETSAEADQTTDEAQDSNQQSSQNPNELTPAQEQIVQDLQVRDLEVRAHEQAHAAVGGRYTGSPSYSYETGPDGKRYAVEGEVSVDLSKPSNPEDTIAKMRKVHQAALAPANPSAQDLRVASEATKAIAQAQTELIQDRFEQEQDENDLSKPLGGSGPSISSLDELGSDSAESFDTFIDSTIAAQDAITGNSIPRSQEIDERALRIESHYSDITQAYERPPRYQFQLQA